MCLTVAVSEAPLGRLGALRQGVYGAFGARRDALFELLDALLAAQPLPLEEDAVPLYAVDGSVWARCDAETSPERGFSHHPSRRSNGQPIVAGWLYQWVAQVRLTTDSWTAPGSVERVPPGVNLNRAAVEQIKRVVARRPEEGKCPLFLFDAGDDPVQLALELGLSRGAANVAIVVRLRSGRCFSADPPRSGGTGRPRRHGQMFTCAAPATWWAPTDEHTTEDPAYGHVRVQAWAGVHGKVEAQAGRGTHGPTPIERGTRLLL